MEHKAIVEALTLNVATKTYRQYFDNTHARLKSKGQSQEFQKILNKQVTINKLNKQFTIDDDHEEKCLNFLDIKINNDNARYEFDVHRKPALTNVQTKPHSCMPSNFQHIQRTSCKSYQYLF